MNRWRHRFWPDKVKQGLGFIASYFRKTDGEEIILKNKRKKTEQLNKKRKKIWLKKNG